MATGALQYGLESEHIVCGEGCGVVVVWQAGPRRRRSLALALALALGGWRRGGLPRPEGWRPPPEPGT